MARLLTRTVAVVCLMVGPDVAAQADCLRRLTPWEPQKTTVWYLKGRSEQRPPTLHVAGSVATTLVFDEAEAEVDSAEFAGDAGKRFRSLEVGAHSVVIIPKLDLAAGEHVSLTVTLKDGTDVPFDLVSPMSDQSSDGQVDVRLDGESPEALQRDLHACRGQVQALRREVEHRLKQENSIDGSLAALLAQSKEEFTPFTELKRRTIKDGRATIKVITYGRRSRKIDLGRAAVVFEVTNADKGTWKLDSIRLSAEPYNIEDRPFALRASARSIAEGGTGRFAVVIAADTLRAGPIADRLVLELWRAGVPRPDRAASVELVAVDDPDAPLQFPRYMSKPK